MMNLQWHGEGDMVGAGSFQPVPLSLTFALGEGRLIVETTATPEIEGDPEYMRREVHKLIDRLVDEIKGQGLM
ncbi:hypothetical protein SEA_MIKO_41 [Mycobacterium phage Miko]|nr:hypothetical protein SEA_MIKO_41 [Mycobacterium phage Miko]